MAHREVLGLYDTLTKHNRPAAGAGRRAASQIAYAVASGSSSEDLDENRNGTSEADEDDGEDTFADRKKYGVVAEDEDARAQELDEIRGELPEIEDSLRGARLKRIAYWEREGCENECKSPPRGSLGALVDIHTSHRVFGRIDTLLTLQDEITLGMAVDRRHEIARENVRDNIVQAWSRSQPTSPANSYRPTQTPVTPPMTEDDERMQRDAELNRKIMRLVEENGITKPAGHKVSFHYNSHVEDMHFGKTHPMKPWRLTLTKHLVLGYGLQYAMDTYEAMPAGKDQVRKFHDPDYVDFLSEVSPQTFERLCQNPRFMKHKPPKHDYDTVDLGPFNLSTSTGADCPVFDGMNDYLFLYTGATLSATANLLSNQSDIAINWSGGLHHAHKGEASGFCYINDIVLAILELLTVHTRVLYIDIDVHHGDGVEEAFQSSPRVMTLSFHRYGPYDDTGHKFFPGTGDVSDVGLRGSLGHHFALNIPIPSGIDDRQYKYLFESTTSRVLEAYKPGAIVMQCGADSLGGDRLGQFNLNIRAHGDCLAFIKKYRIPLLVLGGGGYTARNVARAWCHETALATNNVLPDSIPLDIVPRPEAFSSRPHGDGKLYPSFQRLHPNDCKDAELEAMVKAIEWELKYVAASPWPRMGTLPRNWEALAEQAMGERRAGKGERERRVRERDPGGRGELR